MKWLDQHEAIIRLVFRVVVIGLLLFCWLELHDLRHRGPDLRTLESDVDQIQRDVAKIKEKIDPSPPPYPLPPNLLPRSAPPVR